APHARGRPRVTSATIPSSTPIAPTISATIESVVVPPPPSDETPSTSGAGVSELSEPVQSTISPFEYVCRTFTVYFLLESTLALKRNTAFSSVGTLPPVHVTFWIVFSSPDPVACSLRFQPGSASNESIAKRGGTDIAIWVVVSPSPLDGL